MQFSSRRARLHPWWAVSLGALMLVLLCFRPAMAHSELESSDPANGATLAKAPSRVTLTFGAAVTEPAFVVVTAPDGTRVEDGNAAVLGETVRQPLDPVDTEAQTGDWTVAYRIVSVDGHPVTGELAFTVEGRADGEDNTQTAGTPEQGATGSGAGHSGGHDTAHPTEAAHSSGPADWREYAHWFQLPLAALALGGLYLWSSPGRRRDA